VASLFQLFVMGILGVVVVQALGLLDFVYLRLVVQTQVFLGSAFEDQSFVLRQNAYAGGLERFLENPLTGFGFNQEFSAAMGDTPFSALLKFGAIGFALTASWFFLLARRSMKLDDQHADTRKGIAGWLLVLLALSYSGPVFEDKSTALATVFATALIASSFRESMKLP
jgi:hypothetical protein